MPRILPPHAEFGLALHYFVDGPAQKYRHTVNRVAAPDCAPQIIVVLSRPWLALVDVLHDALTDHARSHATLPSGL
jgi:hypothetical protein